MTGYPAQNLPSHKATQWNVIQRTHCNRIQFDTICDINVRNITICVESQWPILRIVSKRWKQPRNNVMNKHTRLSLNSLSTLIFECIKRSAAVSILVQISVFPLKGGQGGCNTQRLQACRTSHVQNYTTKICGWRKKNENRKIKLNFSLQSRVLCILSKVTHVVYNGSMLLEPTRNSANISQNLNMKIQSKERSEIQRKAS